MNECFYAMYKTSLRFAAAWETSENSLLIYFHIPFRFGCRPREASRLEAKTHEAEAKTHEAEAEAEATTHEAEAEAEAEARFFGLEAEARPRGLTSLPDTTVIVRAGCDVRSASSNHLEAWVNSNRGKTLYYLVYAIANNIDLNSHFIFPDVVLDMNMHTFYYSLHSTCCLHLL